MIPFGSQRGNGADLARHLSNSVDNETVEIADLRGCIADDLAGAFAEWEVQASSLTRSKNYIYSLSINPDERQGRWERGLYFDFVDRVENVLGWRVSRVLSCFIQKPMGQAICGNTAMSLGP